MTEPAAEPAGDGALVRLWWAGVEGDGGGRIARGALGLLRFAPSTDALEAAHARSDAAEGGAPGTEGRRYRRAVCRVRAGARRAAAPTKPH